MGELRAVLWYHQQRGSYHREGGPLHQGSYSGYPDCRREFIQAYENMANLATKAQVEGQKFTIHTPLLDLTKADIIKMGNRLNVDYGITVSCYNADKLGKACGECDSCYYRKLGFEHAELKDPTHYL